MPYTLSMALLWVAFAVLLGIVIGWLMRSVVAGRQVERARANHLDTVELERLRARVAELEPVVTERDRLLGELATAGADARTDRTVGAAAVDVVAPATDPVTASDAARPVSAPVAAHRVIDLTAASQALGVRVELDDLTLIDGIGPKIADLCDGIGIQTWRDLAQTEVSLLRTMLQDAGARFRSHDPASWPEQAALLADGRWAEFRTLTARRDEDAAVD
jgi:predicted flap endonuclease-1-like 5' DNA nuclease